jgi:hypothetical protein
VAEPGSPGVLKGKGRHGILRNLNFRAEGLKVKACEVNVLKLFFCLEFTFTK